MRDARLLGNSKCMIQFNAILEGIRTLKNNSLKITIESQDIKILGKDVIAELIALTDNYVYVGIKESLIKEDELKIKEPELEFKSDKSPSQRLRNILWIYWNENKPTKDFDIYYKRKIEEIITLIKDKLQ